MNKILKIVIMLILVISCMLNAYASEIKVEVESTTARQGDHIAVSVFGTINVDTLNSMVLIFNYNANRLKIDSVKGAVNYAVKCSNPTMFDSTFAEYGTLKVQCSEVQKILDGKICTIYITCLAGSGNEALITPTIVEVDDSTQTANLIAGKITFNDIPVLPKFIEGLGLPSPNPFGSTITIPYTIDVPTNIQFYIYDLVGRLVQEFPIAYKIRGGYSFYFTPNEGELSNGAYYVVMKTDSKVYTSYFLRVR